MLLIWLLPKNVEFLEVPVTIRVMLQETDFTYPQALQFHFSTLYESFDLFVTLRERTEQMMTIELYWPQSSLFNVRQVILPTADSPNAVAQFVQSHLAQLGFEGELVIQQDS